MGSIWGEGRQSVSGYELRSLTSEQDSPATSSWYQRTGELVGDRKKDTTGKNFFLTLNLMISIQTGWRPALSSCPTLVWQTANTAAGISAHLGITSPSTQRATEGRPFPIAKATCFTGFLGGASWTMEKADRPGLKTQLHHPRNCALEQVCKVGVCHLPPELTGGLEGIMHVKCLVHNRGQ